VFKSIFLLVNCSKGGVMKVIRPIETTNPNDFYAGTTTTTTSDIGYERQFEYRITRNPELLEGIDCMWKTVLEAENMLVNLSAVELITDIYENIDPILDLKSIRTSFIEKFLGFVSSCTSPLQRSHAIQLLKTFVEESEKKGTGGVQSHSAMLKG
jgi:hypothetical protein